MPAGPAPTISTSTSSGSSAGRSSAGAGGGLDARVAGDVAVVVKLHSAMLRRQPAAAYEKALVQVVEHYGP